MIDIADQLVIKRGAASITMKSSGDIVIKGAKIAINGSGDDREGTKVAASSKRGDGYGDRCVRHTV
jgi:hypothetical protein